MMNISNLLRVTVVAAIFFAGSREAFSRSSPDPGQVGIAVARWLEQGHYTREKLDENMSRKLLETYLLALDYRHLYFTREDVDEFREKYGPYLGDLIFRGDMSPAREIFSRFRQRVEERVAKNKELAQQKFAFTDNGTVQWYRQNADWPKDQADADRLWHDWIEAELLQLRLNGNKDGKKLTDAQVVTHRYDRILRNVEEMDDEDVVKTFLTSLAQSYDPHSEYMSASDMENFYINMQLSLVGVGAVLSSDDGYATVKDVVPGGPADLDGRLKVKDRIAGVAQGSGDFEDVVDMKLDKVVEKIRGKKGTVVRLEVIPGDATDPSKRKIVEIKRDEVKLKASEAKAQVEDVKQPDGTTVRIGWITLPEFYANMSNQGAPPKSTTDDVKALLERLKQEKIQGLVMDLRRDGGGSLQEAINLTGLFIGKRAVVQAKDSNGKITVSADSDYDQAYNGPMIVITNRLSASASEIFAAALQDYGRAVIVGDKSSFGKGTVQTLLDMGRVMPFFSLGSADAGGLKLTIQKFYRVSGGSTQLKGVVSDVVLPSHTDNVQIGEGSLHNCLGYDEVAPVAIDTSYTPAYPALFLDELRQRSQARTLHDPEFAYIREDMKRLDKEFADGNTISLNETVRRQQLADDKARTEAHKKERAARGPAINVTTYNLPLEDVAKPTLEKVAYEAKPDKKALMMEDDEDSDGGSSTASDKPEPDALKDETLRIMCDLISLDHQGKTASTQNAQQASPQ